MGKGKVIYLVHTLYYYVMFMFIDRLGLVTKSTLFMNGFRDHTLYYSQIE